MPSPAATPIAAEPTGAAIVSSAVSTRDSRKGFVLALIVYLMWGFMPFYMKALAHISPLEFLAHRVVWSVPIAGVVLLCLGRTRDVLEALRSPKTLMMASITAVLISINAGTYIWAVSNNRALEGALGYFINPLFSILLGAFFLKEKLAPAQILAVVLAAIAVAILTWDAGSLPLVALTLTLSWGLYGFFRKTLPIGPNQGFFLEVLLLSIPALPYLIYLESTGRGHFLQTGTSNTLLLIGTGFITAIPLMTFATGAKLLRLSTIGIMQYITPTIVFLIAVFAFGEPLSGTKLIAFLFIWSALIVYTLAMLRPLGQR